MFFAEDSTLLKNRDDRERAIGPTRPHIKRDFQHLLGPIVGVLARAERILSEVLRHDCFVVKRGASAKKSASNLPTSSVRATVSQKAGSRNLFSVSG